VELSSQHRESILGSARAFVRQFLEPRMTPAARAAEAAPDPLLQQPAGCFVTLHTLQDHRLRGCVGRIDAHKPLIEALRHSCQQVLRDPRFATDPVRLDELQDLKIEVSILSQPRPANGPLDFDPAEQGIYLTIGNRSGCFLPQVARETGWTREQLLDRLCSEKLGLPPASWRQPQSHLEVFSVVVIGPEPFVAPARIGKHWDDC
jgi:uncharacterized protein